MKANTFTLDVDIKQENYINEPIIKQNDAVVFVVNLTDNGAPMELTDVTTYSIATERADGVSIVSKGTKTGPSQVTFNMPRETTTSVGRAKETVQLYDADKRVSSFSFPCTVEKDPSASLIVTGGDKTLIELVLGEGPKVIQDAKDATTAATAATGKANTAAGNADSKASAANTAAGAADTAAGKANTAATNADTAAGKVDASIARTDASADAADAAALKANTAANNADGKAAAAQTAADRANAESDGLETLKTDVTAATGAATDAALAANTAADKATTSSAAADASASNADTEATNANTQATAAQTQAAYAKEQGDYAKLQGTHAKTEGDKAALESADLAGMKTAVTQATADAVTAADLANTEATGLAGMKDAVTAATAAAEGASTQATTQADYAKMQGDYAKAQGDAVQGIFDAGLVASVNGKTGAVILTSTDVGAETPAGAQAKADAAQQAAEGYTDTKIAAIPEPDLTPYATTAELGTERAARESHEAAQIHQGPVHGMRLTGGTFEVYDGAEWIEIKGGGGGAVPIGNVENLSAVAEPGLKIKISWNDPADVVLEGITLAKWSGTMLRRKEGTYPVDEKDGTLVVDNTTRDAYAAGYTDTGLTDGATYYYALFPRTDGSVTVDSANRASAKAFAKYAQNAPTKPVVSGLQQNKATVTSSSGSVVSLDQVDWHPSPHEFTGLTDGSQYTPYAKFAETADKWESPVSTGDIFTAVNKLPKPAPSSPSIGGLKFDRATVSADSGALVSLNQADWYAAPHEFADLTPEQSYIAYAKFPETPTHLESPVSSKAFTTPSAVKIYGVKIDTLNSNPETAVTYTDDAVGSTPMRLVGSAITMGSWADRYPFNEITPVVVKNGVEQYELNPNDYTQKKAGGAADITSGAAGDVFVRFSKLWWKIEAIGTDLFVRIATAPTPGYKKLAHTRAGTDLDFAYIGAYLGYNDGGKLRSLSGKTVTSSQTIGTFRTQGQAQGAGYTQFDYYKLLMIQVMLLIATKSRDSQAALGRGYVDGNTSYATTGGTDKKGLNFGETTGKMQNKIFGIEDFWGNYYQWIDGLYSDASWNIMIGDSGYNDTGSGYTKYGKGASANLSGYISQVQGGTETGFIIKEGSGSETTHYADYGDLSSGSLPYFGASRADGSDGGAFLLFVNLAASGSYAIIGGRACFAK